MTALITAWAWFVVLMAGVGALVVVFMAGILVWAWRNPEGEVEFGAALKILVPSVPLWAMLAASPLVVVAYIGIGRLWLTAGWYREAMEVGVVNALDPVHMFTAHALARLLDHHQLPQNGYDPTKLP